MTFIIIISGIAVALYLASFISKRRFGVLGLALLAGATLSGLWGETVTFIVNGLGVHSVAPPLNIIVGAAIIIFPALLLLLSGPTYKKILQRMIGSLAFALLAVALLLEPLSRMLVIDGTGRQVYGLLLQYSVTIITACVIFAVLDLFATRTPKVSTKH